MTVYLIVCGVVFLFIGIVWKTSDFLNATLKVLFICMAVWSAYGLIAQEIPNGVVLKNGMKIY